MFYINVFLQLMLIGTFWDCIYCIYVCANKFFYINFISYNLAVKIILTDSMIDDMQSQISMILKDGICPVDKYTL